jgi:hypothetical protein
MATKGFPTLSYLNLSSFVGKTLNLKAFLYPPRWLGVGIVPHLVSVRQTTLDGRVLSEEEFRGVVDEMSRVPCDKKCLLALEDECRCRCGGINHGKWVKSADHDASLEAFVEDGPVVSDNIVKGKTMLMMLARREVVAAYGSLVGGLRG